MLITPDRYGWYSGMMPGLIAGRYRLDQCRIDMIELCERCGIDLIQDRVRGLDADNQQITLESGRHEQGRWLSLNVGSAPPSPDINAASIEVLPAKPFPILVEAWRRWRAEGAPPSVAVLGGGAAAFELAMALQASLPGTSVRLISGSELLHGHHPRVQRKARGLLREYRIDLTENRHVTRVQGKALYEDDTSLGVTDASVVATGAGAYAWPCKSGLACEEGFISIDATLRSISHRNLFASGDCAALPATPHAGVYAVRQGEILADNLRAALLRGSMKLYHPQPRALALLATGDGRALLSYGPLTAHNRLLGRWKDHLDTRFIEG
ncbi:FAD-dependent oxidoreductase [Halopseudomonas xinjiangensis]|nr:FAD-dependent oxidoreductase [Halopseudomonas xinjiangensis]